MNPGAGPERLETERLLIRRPRDIDIEAIFGFASDRQVTRWVGWPMHVSIDDTRAFLGYSDAEWERWPAGPYVIADKRTGCVFGTTGLSFETPHRAATGYVLAASGWGYGYATEALRAMREVGGTLGARRLYALCHIDHAASARVLEKCGFEREGVLRKHTEFPNLSPGEPCDVLCFACTR
jgi:[ribosomal protein S5]-alanine N-acetyltransferase